MDSVSRVHSLIRIHSRVQLHPLIQIHWFRWIPPGTRPRGLQLDNFLTQLFFNVGSRMRNCTLGQYVDGPSAPAGSRARAIAPIGCGGTKRNAYPPVGQPPPPRMRPRRDSPPSWQATRAAGASNRHTRSRSQDYCRRFARNGTFAPRNMRALKHLTPPRSLHSKLHLVERDCHRHVS